MQSLSRLILFILLIASTEAMSQEFLKYQINWGDDSIGLIEAKSPEWQNVIFMLCAAPILYQIVMKA